MLLAVSISIITAKNTVPTRSSFTCIKKNLLMLLKKNKASLGELYFSVTSTR